MLTFLRALAYDTSDTVLLLRLACRFWLAGHGSPVTARRILFPLVASLESFGFFKLIPAVPAALKNRFLGHPRVRIGWKLLFYPSRTPGSPRKRFFTPAECTDRSKKQFLPRPSIRATQKTVFYPIPTRGLVKKTFFEAFLPVFRVVPPIFAVFHRLSVPFLPQSNYQPQQLLTND